MSTPHTPKYLHQIQFSVIANTTPFGEIVFHHSSGYNWNVLSPVDRTMKRNKWKEKEKKDKKLE